MPFKSKAQRRLFYALDMPKKTIEEWESKTPKNIPEKVAIRKAILNG